MTIKISLEIEVGTFAADFTNQQIKEMATQTALDGFPFLAAFLEEDDDEMAQIPVNGVEVKKCEIIS